MELDQKEFWEFLDRLVATSRRVIDRPKGSTHPRYPDQVYPVDYGYLDETTAMDGAGIDIWVGTLNPAQVNGVICTVDLKKRDTELKILIGCSEQEIGSILNFVNDGELMRGYIIHRLTES